MQLQIKQQEFLTGISMKFASAGDFKHKIQQILGLTGQFLGLERVSVLKHAASERYLERLFEWSIHSMAPPSPVIHWSKIDPVGEIYNLLASGIPVQINSIYDLPEQKQKKWREFAVVSFAAAPIMLNDNFWGLFVLNNVLAPHQWSENEIRLIQTLCGVIATAIERDQIEIKMVERDIKLEEAIKAAEQSARAKSEFMSRMSHEILTPMNAIIGMTRIAGNTDDLSKIKNCLSAINSASKQLMGIINDILDMSKMESGQFVIHNKPFDLSILLKEIADVIMVEAGEKKQNLQIHIDKNVPTSYDGDKLRLSQVIRNLLMNAVKFTQENGSIQLNVSLIDMEDHKANVRFAVIDNGIGISPEQRQRLFEAFEQGSGGISRKYGGTGLGLSICKQIVQMMEGDIWVESREKEGSQFFFNVKMPMIQSIAFPGSEDPPPVHHPPEGKNLKDKLVKHIMDDTNYFQFLPYIDVKGGLSRIRNNKKLYATLLKSFKKNDFLADLTKAVQNGDAANAQYTAHTLKGVASNLSLAKIFEIIVPYETALKGGAIPAGGLDDLTAVIQTTQEQIDQLLAVLESEANS
jgi:signal transduction histidine kinase/HPt (histidine-containing phosphotransfer) domain-containing protein